MYYNKSEYSILKNKYGAYSSWAIWNDKNHKDVSVIDSCFSELNPNFIFLGLNISGLLKGDPWSNFHGGKHDRKLVYACNKTNLRGSYITDIFKDIVDANSSALKKLSNEIIEKNARFFDEEMKDIKIMEKSVFVILGTESSIVSKYFKRYFLREYKNKIINYCHYSYYGISDEKWVEGLREKIDSDIS